MVEQVDHILILTNVTIAAAGAAVDDPCSSRLAFVAYRNSLRKRYQDRYTSAEGATHPSTVFFTEIRRKSNDRVGLGIGSTTAAKARFKPGSLQDKRSASCVRNDE